MDRELVITVPLREVDDDGGQTAGPPAHHRRHLLDLGPRLRAFRAEGGVTQAEVARVVGAATPSTVTQWEVGVTVPDGMRRERLRAMLDGQLWIELRAAMIAGDGMPDRWAWAARWYRRASRQRRERATVGRAIAGALDELHSVVETDALRRLYQAKVASRIVAAMAEFAPDSRRGNDLRRAEDAAYGLRWLELVRGAQFDLNCSLIGQCPVSWLDGEN